ncbi:MAG: hypothetical protein KAG61_04445 [Bacteriovoracaceae bacterium]|nr:hypothetical protein [Bacteriovoracaceae bacterium]
MKLLKFLPFALLMIATSLMADELMVVKAVSTSGKTFAISKGSRDQVSKGQKSLFSTKRFSIMAQAVEVGQENSMWRVSKESATVPFKKGDFINYTRYVNEVWSKLAELKDIYKTRRIQKRMKVSLNPYHISARAGATHAFSENVNISGTSPSNNRQGFQGEATLYRAISPILELGLGLRYDQDSYLEKEPPLQINSKRYFVTFDLNYHFPKFVESLGNIYSTIGMGYGVSQSQIDRQIISGSATILPYVKLGYLHPLTDQVKFITEIQLEVINATEKFTTGENQKTTIVNSRAAIGLRF